MGRLGREGSERIDQPCVLIATSVDLRKASGVHGQESHLQLEKTHTHRDTGGGDPPSIAQCGRNEIVVEALDNYERTPQGGRKPPNSVRLRMVCCIVQCLHTREFFPPHWARGGGGAVPATREGTPFNKDFQKNLRSISRVEYTGTSSPYWTVTPPLIEGGGDRRGRGGAAV